MNNSYELLKDEDAIVSSIVELLEPFVDSNANWNSDRYAYIYTIIYNNLTNITPDQAAHHIHAWNSIVFSVFPNRASLRDYCITMYPEIDNAPKALVTRSVFALIIQHIAVRKLIRYNIRAFPKFRFSQSIVNSSLFNALPRVVKFFCYIQTENTLNEFKHLLHKNENLAILNLVSTTRARSNKWNNSVTAFRRFIFHHGLSSFSDITASKLKKYKLALGQENISLGINYFLPAISQISGNDLNSVIGSPISTKARTANSISDQYSVLLNKQAFKLTGLTNVAVKKKKIIPGAIIIGSWSCTKTDIKEYTPNTLKHQTNPWILTQLEYLSYSNSEAGTKKQMNAAFGVLNLYILSYLDHFFKENTNLPYPYPKEVKDFHGFIYVSPTMIMSNHIFNKKISKLPVGLIDFIKSLLKTDSLKANNNTIRDSIARLRHYFDWVINRFGSINAYSLSSNPITKNEEDTIKGTSYKSSNKAKFEIEYWILLQEFLNTVSDKLLHDAETSTTDVTSSSIQIDKEIHFAKYTAKISKVDMSCFTKISLDKGNKKRIKVLPYQQYSALNLMANCGIRLSNTMWLDTRSFDCLFNPKMDNLDACLWVNTDKAKEEPFNSTINLHIMDMAQRVKNLRASVIGIPQTPFPYQQNPNSKWGDILPLFQYSQKNNFDNIQNNLSNILFEFEKCIKESNLNFNSVLFYSPVHIGPKDFLMLKSNKVVINDKHHSIIWEENGEQQEAFFTPVQFKTALSVHSLRKTFCSYISIFLGNEATGKIYTGQTPGAVGYYTENTPDEENKILSSITQHKASSKTTKSFVSIWKNSVDEDNVIKALLTKGLPGINGITLATSNKKEDNIEGVLASATANDIAINRTHICPCNNICPRYILDRLEGKKNCALCPLAISTTHDAPAILARIKQHCDHIADINSMLDSGHLNKSERDTLLKERIEEVNFACSWYARHKFMNSYCDEDGMLVLDDGLSEIKRIKLNTSSNETELLIARLHEVESIPTLQSQKLKAFAKRMNQRLLVALKDNKIELPETNEVELSVALIKKVSSLHKLSTSQLVKLLECDDQKKLLSSPSIFHSLSSL